MVKVEHWCSGGRVNGCYLVRVGISGVAGGRDTSGAADITGHFGISLVNRWGISLVQGMDWCSGEDMCPGPGAGAWYMGLVQGPGAGFLQAGREAGIGRRRAAPRRRMLARPGLSMEGSMGLS
jgi:hypothetical protein